MLCLERLKVRIRELFLKKPFENEMDEELRFHFESLIRENIHTGMSTEEARRAACLAFGGVDRVKEDCRDTRWTRILDEAWLDLRHALRLFMRNPSFAAICIILIAATVGLMCASYAVMDALVLRTLPVPHPEQLVVINQKQMPTAAVYDALERERQDVSQISGVKGLLMYGSAGDSSRSLSIYGVKGDFFGMMGVRPQLGRFLAADERAAVAVISDRLWRREFGRAPDILGRTITVGAMGITVVGVAGQDFIAIEEPYSNWDAIIPSEMFGRIQGMGQIPLQIVARLKTRITAEEYEAQLNSIWPTILQMTVPPKTTLDEWRDRIGARAQVESASRGINYVLLLQPNIQLAIQITFGLSVLIFFSGCLALILLAIARSIRNRHQTAIMLALGGGRWRVQRPFLMEILILSGIGCAIGLMIAWWWSSLGTTFLPDSQRLNWHVRVDARVVTLALLLALCVAAILGVAGNMAYFGPRWGNSTIAFVHYTVSRGGANIMVRSKRNLEELGRAIQALLDPHGVHCIAYSADQKALLSSSPQQERTLATIAGAFGGLIVLLAGVELYAFCNYLFALRAKELAIRASVGASPAQIAAALVKEIIRALAFGLVIGSALILIGQRIPSGLAAILNPPDLRYLGIALALVTGIATSAVLGPALRAVRLNVAQALRVD